MKIIDFEKKGNVVRYYLGDDGCTDYWGDDWNDAPYEHNAGRVYDEYVKSYKDVSYPFDSMVLEPSDSYVKNFWWSKEDMKKRNIPCIIVVNGYDGYHDDFAYWCGAVNKNVKKIYFGDPESALDN